MFKKSFLDWYHDDSDEIAECLWISLGLADLEGVGKEGGVEENF